MNPSTHRLDHRMGLDPNQFRDLPIPDKKGIPNGKSAVENTTTGHTPPPSPKHAKEEATAKAAAESMPKPAADVLKPVSDRKVEPLLAYKDEADKFKSSIRDVASKIVGVVIWPFLAIAAFFSRLGGRVKEVFVKPTQQGPDPISKVFIQHLADVVVHLTNNKAIGHFPDIVKKGIAPLFNNILVDSNVLPRVVEKLKDALGTFFTPGKAKAFVDKLEKNLLGNLANQLAIIRQYEQDTIDENRINKTNISPEAGILQHLANKANEDMSQKEFLEFAKRYPLVSKHQQIIKDPANLLGQLDALKKKLDSLNWRKEKKINVPSAAEIQAVELEIETIKNAISAEESKLNDLVSDMSKLVLQLKERATDPKTPIFQMQQLREDIKTLEQYLSGKQPKTHVGVLHKAVYPLTDEELNSLAKRYDIIRNHNPKLGELEKIEADYYSKLFAIKKLKNELNELLTSKETSIKKAELELDQIQKHIKVLQEKDPQPTALLKMEAIREKQARIHLEAEKKIAKAILKQKETEIAALQDVIKTAESEAETLAARLLKIKEEVNMGNYSTQAILEKIQKIVPGDDVAYKAKLEDEIATLKKVIEIEDKIYEHEQKYLRDISLKIFNLIYPNPDDLPVKITLPLRILKQDPKEFILKMLDMSLFNAIDGISDPGVIFGLVNDFLKDLKVKDQASQNVAAYDAHADKAIRALTPTAGLEEVAKEMISIGFPVLGSMIGGAFALGRGYVGVRDFLGKFKNYFSSSMAAMPNGAASSQDIAKDLFAENILPKVIQFKINKQKEALAQQLETPGNVINQGLALADQAMFPDGRLRVFRSGYTNAEMTQLKADLQENIHAAIKGGSADNVLLDQAKGAVGNYIERFNMQAVNKQLIYGMLDQVIAALEV